MSEQIILDDPEIAALLNAHAEERAEIAIQNPTEAPTMPHAERAGLDPSRCPYLGSLSIGDRSAVLATYGYQEVQPEPVHTLVERPAVALHFAQEITEQLAVPAAVDATPEVAAESVVEQPGGSGGELPMGAPDEVTVFETSAPPVFIVKETKPVTKIKKASQEIVKPVAVVAQQKPQAQFEAPIVVEAVEQLVVEEQITADANILLSPDLIALQPQEKVTIERTAPEITVVEAQVVKELAPINLELLGEVEPQLAQTFAAIAEHSGTAILEKSDISVLPVEATESITEFLQTAAPEKAVAVEAIVVLLEVAADRLTTLAEKDVLNETEAAAIVEFIVEWFADLAERGVSVGEQDAYKFVIEVLEKANIPQAKIQKLLTNWGDGTRELKLQHPHSLAQVVGINTESRSDRWPLGWLYSLVA